MIPIVPHVEPSPEASARRRARRLAGRLRRVDSFDAGPLFEPCRVVELETGGALHLDDLSEIPLLDRYHDVSFMEDRARLRAADGDVVASCSEPVAGFERYCERRLGLGVVDWLRPRPWRSALSVAGACWSDREVRRKLVAAFAEGRLRYLHPHLGSFPVWALASLLREASGAPVEVIAPPPQLTRRVNDKVWFADVVRRLFGRRAVPPSFAAWNTSTLARVVAVAAERSDRIVVKVPDSAGGAGNFVFDATTLRGLPVGRLRTVLGHRLAPARWEGDRPLQVSTWESDVLCSPSSQLWIPPARQGAPIVEGIFEQLVHGDAAEFVGARPARLPAALHHGLAECSWLLARLFQRLGYVGRCSFDTLLIGSTLGDARIEFIECNGRWGGTSIPMTLMNRLFGDWERVRFATRACSVPEARGLTFEQLCDGLGDDLYDRRTGRGRVVLFNPGRLQSHGGIDLITWGTTAEAAGRALAEDLPRRLRQIASPAVDAASAARAPAPGTPSTGRPPAATGRRPPSTVRR